MIKTLNACFFCLFDIFDLHSYKATIRKFDLLNYKVYLVLIIVKQLRSRSEAFNWKIKYLLMLEEVINYRFKEWRIQVFVSTKTINSRLINYSRQRKIVGRAGPWAGGLIGPMFPCRGLRYSMQAFYHSKLRLDNDTTFILYIGFRRVNMSKCGSYSYNCNTCGVLCVEEVAYTH